MLLLRARLHRLWLYLSELHLGEKMRPGTAAIIALAALAGCSSGPDKQTFSVFFNPYSSSVDQQAQDSIQSAAAFAQAHPASPILLTGYSAPADPKLDVDGLSAQRAVVVTQALVSDGINPDRVSMHAAGVTDPKEMPSVAVRRVDIRVGP